MMQISLPDILIPCTMTEKSPYIVTGEPHQLPCNKNVICSYLRYETCQGSIAHNNKTLYLNLKVNRDGSL